mgnify:CR=1 FL=1
MTKRFDNKVAIITAGGSGIGAATERRFTQEGASVVIADLSGKRAEEVTKGIVANGGKAVCLKMDASDPEGIQATIKLALDTYGRLDVLFNNAGAAEVGALEDTTLESWNRVMAVTLTSTFLGMKYCLPIMRKQGKGTIINTASVSGTAGDYGLSSYNAAKAGVINLTRAAAIEEHSDLVADCRERRQQSFIRLADLAAEKLEHALHVAAQQYRKTEGGVQPFTRGDGRARKIRVLRDVRNPGGVS